DVELAAGDALELLDQLVQLPLDVRTVAREATAHVALRPHARARARHVDRDHRRVVEALPDLRPLQVRVAGVRQHGDGGRRDATARVLTVTQLQRVVRLDIAADVR